MTPIDFPVQVNGTGMTATVIEEIIPPYNFIFRVRFSNGFEDRFYVGDAGVHGSRESSRPYANAISTDIGYVLGLDPDAFHHIFQENIEGAMTNVWIIERKKDFKTSYAVYYNRFYRFELTKENGEWVATTTAKIYPNINFELAKKVGFQLDTLLCEK